jgi:16S rRNA processing protein RimM
MPESEKNEFYNKDLIGCSVLSEDNECFGQITRVLESKSGVLLEVLNNRTTYLVPFTNSFIISVNIDNKILVIKNLEEIASL